MIIPQIHVVRAGGAGRPDTRLAPSSRCCHTLSARHAVQICVSHSTRGTPILRVVNAVLPVGVLPGLITRQRSFRDFELLHD
jgi:hypothetical protein